MFTEKYEPKEFKDIIGLNESIIEFAKEDNIPDFLFYGPPGTGKTTTAKVIVNSLDSEFILLNGSDERGIDVIRERVKNFARHRALGDRKKIVIIDEADGLTSDSQDALRGIMDKFKKSCSFIFTSNSFYKTIEPLRSRCICIEFKTPPESKIINLLEKICIEENISFKILGLENIVKYTYPDIRRAIKELETIHRTENEISEETTKIFKNKITKIIRALEENNLHKAIKIYEKEHIDEEFLMENLADLLFHSSLLDSQKIEIMKIIRTAYVQMSRVLTKKLIIRPFLSELSEIL